MLPIGTRRGRPLTSSGTRVVSVFAVGITHDAGKISNCKIKRGYVVAAFAAANAECKMGARRGEHLYNCLDVLASRHGKHGGNFASQTKVQRYQPDRLLVHGVVRLHSNDRKGRA